MNDLAPTLSRIGYSLTVSLEKAQKQLEELKGDDSE